MARSDIGTMTIYMDAVTDQFHAGLNTAQSAIQSFKSKLGLLNKNFRAIAGAVRTATSAVKIWNATSALITAKNVEETNSAVLKLQSSLEAIPGLGLIFEGVHEFKMVVTGTKEEIAGWNKELAASVTLVDDVVAASERMQDFSRDFVSGVKAAMVPMQDELDRLTVLDRSGEEAASSFEEMMRFHRQTSELVEAMDEAREGTGRFEGMAEPARLEALAALQEQLKLLEGIQKLTEKISGDELKAVQAVKDKAVEDERLLGLKKAQAKLAAAQEKRQRIKGQDLAGDVNTFTSPMGTISLPALNTTAELARQQLTELRAIEQTITGLEATIKDLTKP